jgi:hypothetical protein
MRKMSWKAVLDCKKHFGHINKIYSLAVEAGYNYFVWNGDIWAIDSIKNEANKTDMTIDDIE